MFRSNFGPGVGDIGHIIRASSNQGFTVIPAVGHHEKHNTQTGSELVADAQ